MFFLTWRNPSTVRRYCNLSAPEWAGGHDNEFDFFLRGILPAFDPSSQDLVSNITHFYGVKLVKISASKDDGDAMVKKLYFSLTNT
ncbi:hypothetical protein L9G16_01300 [Shewanella sp. A25]|nr:hypothetical protein [Shewanella shenzhenensis]